MDIHIDTHHVDLPGTGTNGIAQRVERALQRFGDNIQRISITLREDRGSRAGRSKTCLMRVDLTGGGQVVVMDRSTMMRRALIRCLRRGRSLVARELRRRRAVERRRRLSVRLSFQNLALQP